MNNKIKNYQVWFVTGSQHLYGAETLKQVDKDSEIIAKALNSAEKIPVEVVFKPVVTTSDEIYNICNLANNE
ncbi:MAG TPA: L-arabinose isomerase, partial [Marinilabiliales bacterium]|nr:L-arabinose isomerase [Marinilabiliales bacterium]